MAKNPWKKLSPKGAAKKLVPAKEAAEKTTLKPSTPRETVAKGVAVEKAAPAIERPRICAFCAHYTPPKDRCKRYPPDQNVRFSVTNRDETCGEWWSVDRREEYWKARGL